jgi:pyruvate formate lyase activating enzyme
MIRIPIIPGFNDSDENITETALFVKQIGNVQKLELLPYHKLGVLKYERLGVKYKIPNIEPPWEPDVIRLKKLVETHNISCEIQ